MGPNMPDLARLTKKSDLIEHKAEICGFLAVFRERTVHGEGTFVPRESGPACVMAQGFDKSRELGDFSQEFRAP